MESVKNDLEGILNKKIKDIPNFPICISYFYEKRMSWVLEIETTDLLKYRNLGRKKIIIMIDWILSLGFKMDSYPILDSKFYNDLKRSDSMKGYERLWGNVMNLKDAIMSADLNPENYPFLTEEFWEKEFKKNKSK
jgi:hypothetical protein